MEIIFDDTAVKTRLYPFTSTRSAADIRIGILTIREKWDFILSRLNAESSLTDLNITANIIPTKNYVEAFVLPETQQVNVDEDDMQTLLHPWDIFLLNDWALRKDFELITAGRKSQPIPVSNSITGADNIFIEEGAVVEFCTINAVTGPVYIGKNSLIMEGTVIRGPFALCEGAVVKMGAKIYGATTIGPFSVVGGEIKNSVIMGYSNKAHDGYLGDSVIGEWCNLGAGTTNSNIKNSAGFIKVWDNNSNAYLQVGLKCGLLMGDYSRTAINTRFNTGTMVGVCCNITEEGFPPKYIPCFTWGKEKYIFNKALEHIGNWKKLKNQELTDNEIEQLQSIYNQ